jgi:aryl-alcohol dehydrogenase-like predicted oxidoreductase
VPEEDVARLVLGTAALGLPYGLPEGGAAAPVLVPEEAARGLIHAALAAGIATFDTAPAYGEAEARVGRALAGQGQVWTKVSASVSDGLTREVARSVEASLERLRRPRVELVSWHNWTPSLAGQRAFRECWSELRRSPAIGSLGATTYGEDDAGAAVESGLFDVVQVEWNLLRQGVLRRLRNRAVPIAVRSVWLQGVLTPRSRALPPFLRALEPSLEEASGRARAWGFDLETLALRAALDQPSVERVVIGIDSLDQLAVAVRAARAPRLAPDQLEELALLDRGDDPLTDPRTWALGA